jgi:hypothetical protein
MRKEYFCLYSMPFGSGTHLTWDLLPFLRLMGVYVDSEWDRAATA